jgi:hypothetical protein
MVLTVHNASIYGPVSQQVSSIAQRFVYVYKSHSYFYLQIWTATPQYYLCLHELCMYQISTSHIQNYAWTKSELSLLM